MIGPLNRFPGAHAPQIETALAFTAPGQATFADPTLPYTCGDCAHWVELKDRKKEHGSLSRILGSHARPPRQARRKVATGLPGVRARREGCRAMSMHEKEDWLERVRAILEIWERASRVMTRLARSLESAIARAREADILGVAKWLVAQVIEFDGIV